jgi:hypothetical protein
MNSTCALSSSGSTAPRGEAQAAPDAARRADFDQALQRAAKRSQDGEDARAEGVAGWPAAAGDAQRTAVRAQEAGDAPGAARSAPAAVFEAALKTARTEPPTTDAGAAQRWELALPGPGGAALAVQLSAAAQSPWTLRVLSGRAVEREALRASLGSLRTRLDSGAAQVGELSVGDAEN